MKTTWILFVVLLPVLAFSQVTWEAHVLDGSFGGARGVFAADLDQDGDTDIIAAGEDADQVAWWENLGSNTFSAKHVINDEAYGAQSVFVADLDDDGDLDVLSALAVDNEIVWYENDGTQQFTLRVIDTFFNHPIDAIAADLDSNGLLDVMATGAIADEVRLYNQSSPGVFSFVANSYAGQEPRQMDTGDLDGDGDLDVAVTAALSDDLFWFENQGNNTFGVHGVDLTLNGAYAVDAADVDGDDDIDLAAVGVLEDRVYWYENDGTGVFSSHLVDNDLDGAADVIVGDIDNDFDMDIVAVSVFDVYWYEQIDGEFTKHLVDATFDGGRGVYLADVDGDNDLDIVGGAEHADDVIWWEQEGTPPVAFQLFSPNGGEHWLRGAMREILWGSTTPDVPIDITLYEGMTQVLEIATATENDGSFLWSIPDDLPLGDEYRVAIELTIGGEYDESDADFSVESAPVLTVTVFDPPVNIQPGGGGFWYWITVENLASIPLAGQIWTEAITPGGNHFGPLRNFPKTIEANETWASDFPYGQWVPANAPAGDYEYVVHFDAPGEGFETSQAFDFTKLVSGSVSSVPLSLWNIADWHALDGNPSADEGVAAGTGPELPQEYTLAPVYPNPFNAMASVSVALPEAGELTVAVFNAAGQQVLTLQEGYVQAGTHNYSLDMAQFASGLYFVRATVPGKLHEVRKAMLVR